MQARPLHQNKIMKTTLLFILSTLWRSPKRHFLKLLLLIVAWPVASIAQAQAPVTVGVWGGDNSAGSTSVPLAAQSGVTVIAAGDGFSAALKKDGSVVEWSPYNLTSGFVAAQSGVTAIAAGGGHLVFLKNDGSVTAWGRNGNGQTNVPAGLSGVTAVAAGGDFSVALKNDGSIVVWGKTCCGLTNVPVGAQSGVAAIAAGHYHTVVLVALTAPAIITPPVSQSANEWQRARLAVVATGFPVNYQWRQGGADVAGATSATFTLPFATTIQAGSYTVVVSNPAGSVTSAPPAVLTVNAAAPGAVVAWGGNNYNFGQTTLPETALSGVTAIAVGYHTVALKSDGSVVAWGKSSYGQTTVPAGLSGVVAIAVGSSHSVALKSNGTVVAWGAGTVNPSSGDAAQDRGQSIVPAGLSGVTAIAAAALYTVALKSDGSVVAWGEIPTNVPVAAQSGVTAIAAGGSCGLSCFTRIVALKSDGSVVAWGRNDDGEVTGIPTTPDPDSEVISATANPLTLGGRVLSGVTAIAAGGNHTVALLGGVALLPRLSARASGKELILSWPTNAAGFKLQSVLNLTPPATWIDSTPSPAVIGAQFTVTNAASGRAQFYRLNKP